MWSMDHPTVISLKHCFFFTQVCFECLFQSGQPEPEYATYKCEPLHLSYFQRAGFIVYSCCSNSRNSKQQYLLVDPLSHLLVLCDFGIANLLNIWKGRCNNIFTCSTFNAQEVANHALASIQCSALWVFDKMPMPIIVRTHLLVHAKRGI